MWVTLDFEASGLSEDSYPIEVGYSLPDGTSASYLINPSTSSEPWQYWDDYAELNIHGIARNQLLEQGLAVSEVCLHLNEVLGQYEQVLCDSQWDLFWLGRLYKACHMRPSFTLTEIGHWLHQYPNLKREDFAQALERLGPASHRAEQDAVSIRIALSELVE